MLIRCIFIAGLFLSLKDIASLGLCLHLTEVLTTVCRVYFNSYYPKMCSLWISDSVNEIKRIFLKSQGIGYFLWFSGYVVLIFLGNPLLQICHSKTLLPATGVILLYAFFHFMELTHGNCTMLISSKNSVPFVKAAVAACAISLILMFVFCNLNFGIYGFPLAMVCANLPYNSWKWTWEAYKLLYMNKQ